MKILAIQNCPVEGFGRYERMLLDQGAALEIVPAYRRPSFPPLEDMEAILVGGTPISAYQAQAHPFLREECDYLQRALAAEKPCLGICCGAQLLAQLLGAAVRRCRRPEIGVYEARLTPAGRRDPLLAGFPARFPVFHWHGDTFDVPGGGELLVEGDDCRHQLFRCGSVVGLQFHLEVTGQDAAAWADAYADELAAVGKSKAQVVAECRQRDPEMEVLAARLLRNFLTILP